MKLLLLGGFLGAGKTTVIEEAVKYLQSQGHTTAVITNDQGNKLVDTEYLQQHSNIVEQVKDGCFCCNYDQLSDVLRLLEKKSPEFIFAEAVGSCTDMVATVIKPLQKQFVQISSIFTVVVDASLLFRQIQEQKFIFKKEVQYIWQTQLQEADIIIVSKIDELPLRFHASLKQSVLKKYVGKKILFQNNKEQQAVMNWISVVNNFEIKPRLSAEVDYAIYAEGEAALAWLDAELKIEGDEANLVAEKLIENFKRSIDKKEWQIGHLKFLVKNKFEKRKISFTSALENQWERLSFSESDDVTIILNARIECEPDELYKVFTETIAFVECQNTSVTVEQINYFKPGFPRPIHQVMELI